MQANCSDVDASQLLISNFNFSWNSSLTSQYTKPNPTEKFDEAENKSQRLTKNILPFIIINESWKLKRELWCGWKLEFYWNSSPAKTRILKLK